MSAVFVGSPAAGQKVLRRSEFSTQRNGLEFINEIYTIRASDRASLQPNFKTLHKNYSSSSIKYARMAVENVAFKELDGDLTEMTISYVGLTSSSGVPPALVRIIPQMDKGVYGPPCVISVEFVSESTTATVISQLPSSNQNVIGSMVVAPMPKSINGTALPSNPVDPFNTGNTPLVANRFFAGGYSVTNYLGYVLQSIEVEERGIFSLVVHEYAEKEEKIFVG